MLREFTDEIINAIEDRRVSKFVTAAREGQLPEGLVKQIATDCHYPAGSKRCLQVATPKVACKWLNAAGVSAEYADELALVTAAGAIFLQGRQLGAKLQELIDQVKAAREKQERDAAKPSNPQAGPGH